MEDENKAKEQLIQELTQLRQRITELEKAENEYKQLEKILCESKEHYRIVADFTYGWETWTDPTCKFVYVSPSCERISGYSAAEFINDFGLLLRIIHPDDVEKITAHFPVTIDTGTVFLDFRIIHRDGTIRWIEHACQPVYDQKGNWCGQRASNRDITDHKQAEVALLESEKLYRSLINAVPDAITATNLAGKITYASPQTLELHGFEQAEELIGKSAFVLITPEEHEKAKANMLKTLEKKVLPPTEYVLLRKDGTRFNGELTASVQTDINGNPFGFIAATRDITERKKVEKENIIFAELGHQLNAVSTEKTAAQIIITTTDEMLGWDCFWLDLFSIDGTSVDTVLCLDIVDGKRQEVPETYKDDTPAQALKRCIPDGARLILRKGLPADSESLLTFGDKSRRSASLMFVPIRVAEKIIGLLSIQSYTPNAYTSQDLKRLQSFANYAGIALERIRIEQQVVDDRERYQAIMQQATEGILLVDFKTKQVLEVNPAYGKLLGYTEAEFKNLTLYDVVASDRESIDRYCQRIYDEGQVFIGERRHRRKNGMQVDVESSASFIKYAGKETICVIVRDITERKQTEKITQTFAKLGLQLAKADTLDSLAISVAKAVDTLLGYDAFLFSQRLPGGEMFQMVYAEDIIHGKRQGVNADDVSINIYRPMGNLLQGEPFMLNRGPTDELQNWIRFGDETRPSASLLFAPVCFGEEVCGLLSAQSYTPQRYQTADLAILKSIADVIAPALRRVQMEKNLRESEEKYRLLIENVNDAIVISQNEKFIFFNRRFAELLGYKPEELVMKDYCEFYTPESIKILLQRQEMRTRGEPVPNRYETVFWKKDGTNIDLEANVAIIDYGGAPATFAVLRDITERKQTVEALRESEARYRQVVETSPDVIYNLSAEDGIVTFLNSAFEKITGWKTAEWLGKPFMPLIHPDDLPRANETFHQVIHGETLTPYELRVRAKSGEYLIGEFTSFPQIEHEKIVGESGVVRDITDRKKIEEELRESEARYRMLVETSPDSILVVALNGNVLMSNRQATALTGYEYKTEIIGQNILDWIVSQDQPRIVKNLLKTIKTGFIKKFDCTARKKDGTLFSLEMNASLIVDTQRTPKAFIAVLRDITDRKEAEEKIIKSQQKLRALATHLNSIREEEKTQIAREIHDELGQSLTALKMDIFWLGKKFSKEQKPLTKKTKSMEKLIEQTIKTVKRISTELRPGMLDDLGLPATLEWQADEFHRHTRIPCRVTISPANITVNREQATVLFRIFQETLTNIARHAKATRVTVSLIKKKGWLTLTVNDNGKGITPKQINAVNSLGLIGIRERALSLGGKSEIKGIKGKGTTVIISIPISKP
jgi:PAS domain S-box-containing protein